jgi:hypothetical protein
MGKSRRWELVQTRKQSRLFKLCYCEEVAVRKESKKKQNAQNELQNVVFIDHVAFLGAVIHPVCEGRGGGGTCARSYM